MAHKLNKLQKRIMRRVYYAFALRLATNTIAFQALLLVASVYLLSYFISVSSIISNMLNIKVGDLGRYIVNAFMHAQVLTLILIGVIFFTAISLRFSLKTIQFRSVQTI